MNLNECQIIPTHNSINILTMKNLGDHHIMYSHCRSHDERPAIPHSRVNGDHINTLNGLHIYHLSSSIQPYSTAESRKLTADSPNSAAAY